MLRKRVKRGLTVLGLGAMLAVGVGSWGVAGAASQAPLQTYTGQVREIKIDQCGLQPGTCEGSMVLEQSGGQEVALAIQPGTRIQRGDQLVHLDELGSRGLSPSSGTWPAPGQADKGGYCRHL